MGPQPTVDGGRHGRPDPHHPAPRLARAGLAVWTDAATWADWLWPARFETVAHTDVRVGGSFTVTSGPMGLGVSGRYLDVEPHRRLGFSWTWDGEPEQTQVTVTLDPTENGTDLTLQHTDFPTDAARDEHVQGWNDCLRRLVEAFAGR